MADILHIIEMVATLAVALACSCLGLLALAKFAINLAQTVRGASFGPSSQDGDGPERTWPRDRFKIVAELVALLAMSAILFWLSYALARWAWAPAR